MIKNLFIQLKDVLTKSSFLTLAPKIIKFLNKDVIFMFIFFLMRYAILTPGLSGFEILNDIALFFVGIFYDDELTKMTHFYDRT